MNPRDEGSSRTLGRDPLQCSFDDARRNHLLDGIALSARAKVEYSEEMVSLIVHFGARDRLRVREQELPSAGSPRRAQCAQRNAPNEIPRQLHPAHSACGGCALRD